MHKRVFSSGSKSASCCRSGPPPVGDVRVDAGADRLGERFSGVAGAEWPTWRRVVAGEAEAERTVLGVVGGL